MALDSSDLKQIEALFDRKMEEAKEEILFALPETWSNLAIEMKAQAEVAEKFYKDHPEFKDHKDIVQHIIALEDGKNPLLSIKDKLGKAVPAINRRIEETKGLSMQVNHNPSLEYKQINMPSDSGNGEI
jgi:hypothetical protein